MKARSAVRGQNVAKALSVICLAMATLQVAPAAAGIERSDLGHAVPHAAPPTPEPAVLGEHGGATPNVDEMVAGLPPLDLNDDIRDSMMRDYGIDAPEAHKRLHWQATTQDFPATLQAVLGDDFGGTWIEQSDGGRIKIGVTSTSHDGKLSRLLEARGANDYTDIVYVEYSDADLHREVSRLSWSLSDANANADLVMSVGIDHEANRVVLDVPRLEARTHAQQDFIEAIGGSELVTLRNEAGPPLRRHSCSGNACNPPLRAGVKIRLPSVRECTSGFTARSRSDGLPYLFTAGHCLQSHHTTTWDTWTPGPQTWRQIGRRHNHVFGNNQGDFGIIRVNDGTYWNPRAWLLLYDGPDSTRNTRYVVQRTSLSRKGMRICYSGAFSGSRCGEVDKLGDSVTDKNGITTVGLGRFHGAGCGLPGDSGGPTFSYGTAYGLLVGRRNTPILGCRLYYQGINGAASTMNVWVNTE